MPLKEFICPNCKTIFEKLVSVNTVNEKCPKCGAGSGLNYTGACNCIKKGGEGGCSGNCCSCGGCKH